MGSNQTAATPPLINTSRARNFELLRSADGYILVTFSAVLPVILSVMALLVATYVMFSRKLVAQRACIMTSIRGQSLMASRLNQLLALNPRAARLRRQKKIAQQALATAVLTGQPEAIATAKAALKLVRLQQVILRGRQQRLIFELKITAKENQLQIRTALYQHRAQHVFSRRSQPSLLALPPAAVTPTYKPSPEFSALITARTTWRSPLPQFMKNLLRFLKAEQLAPYLPGQCAVTLVKGDWQRWHAQLRPDKSWWN